MNLVDNIETAAYYKFNKYEPTTTIEIDYDWEPPQGENGNYGRAIASSLWDIQDENNDDTTATFAGVSYHYNNDYLSSGINTVWQSLVNAPQNFRSFSKNWLSAHSQYENNLYAQACAAHGIDLITPTLKSPPNGKRFWASSNTGRIYFDEPFTWENLYQYFNLLSQRFQISNSQNFATIVYEREISVSTNSYTPTPPYSSLLIEGKFYWRVVTIDSYLNQYPSQSNNFQIKIDNIPPQSKAGAWQVGKDFIGVWVEGNDYIDGKGGAGINESLYKFQYKIEDKEGNLTDWTYWQNPPKVETYYKFGQRNPVDLSHMHKYYFRSQATDYVDNVEPSPAAPEPDYDKVVQVDLISPEVKKETATPVESTTFKEKVAGYTIGSVEAYDDGLGIDESTIKIELRNTAGTIIQSLVGTYDNITGKISFAIPEGFNPETLPDGTYQIKLIDLQDLAGNPAKVLDEQGNLNNIPYVLTEFLVDNNPPNITQIDIPGVCREPVVKGEIKGDDAGSGIDYFEVEYSKDRILWEYLGKFDAEKIGPTLYKVIFSFQGEFDQTYYFRVKAVDKVGLESEYFYVQTKIEGTKLSTETTPFPSPQSGIALNPGDTIKIYKDSALIEDVIATAPVFVWNGRLAISTGEYKAITATGPYYQQYINLLQDTIPSDINISCTQFFNPEINVANISLKTSEHNEWINTEILDSTNNLIKTLYEPVVFNLIGFKGFREEKDLIWDGKDKDEKIVDEGFYKVRVSVSDVAGNKSIAEKTIQVDKTKPNAYVKQLPSESERSFFVEWSGEDNVGGSGIQYFDVQYKEYDSTDKLIKDWSVFKFHTTTKSAIFTGYPAHKYYFRAIAQDFAGNKSELKPEGDTYTKIVGVSIEIFHSPISTVPISTPIEFKITVTSEANISKASIFYRYVGNNYNELPMQEINQGEYKVTLPGDLVTTDDIEYYVYVKDINNNKVFLPANYEELPFYISTYGLNQILSPIPYSTNKGEPLFVYTTDVENLVKKKHSNSITSGTVVNRELIHDTARYKIYRNEVRYNPTFINKIIIAGRTEVSFNRRSKSGKTTKKTACVPIPLGYRRHHIQVTRITGGDTGNVNYWFWTNQSDNDGCVTVSLSARRYHKIRAEVIIYAYRQEASFVEPPEIIEKSATGFNIDGTQSNYAEIVPDSLTKNGVSLKTYVFEYYKKIWVFWIHSFSPAFNPWSVNWNFTAEGDVLIEGVKNLVSRDILVPEEKTTLNVYEDTGYTKEEEEKIGSFKISGPFYPMKTILPDVNNPDVRIPEVVDDSGIFEAQRDKQSNFGRVFLKIVGTVQDTKYALQYSHDRMNWFNIEELPPQANPINIEKKILAYWDITDLPGGEYSVRLIVNDLEEQRIPVVIGQPITPEAGGMAISAYKDFRLNLQPNSVLKTHFLTIRTIPRDKINLPKDVPEPVSPIFEVRPYLTPKDILIPAKIMFRYYDDDNDGIVDRTNVNETDLAIYRQDITTFELEEIPSKVNTNENYVSGDTIRTSYFMLIPKVAPLVISQVFASPYIFSPNDDLRCDRTTIFYTLSKDGKVTIKVYNEAGSLITTLIQNEERNAGSNYEIWDGKAGNIPVLDGEYTITIYAEDLEGSPAIPVSIKVIVDNTPPTISNIAVIGSPFSLRISGVATLIYELPEKSWVTIKILDSEGNLVHTLVNKQERDGGSNEEKWNGVGATTDGVYIFSLEAEDEAGNYAERKTWEVIIDSTPPRIENVRDAPDPFSPNESIGVKDVNKIEADIIEINLDKWDVEIGKEVEGEFTPEITFSGTSNKIEVEWNGRDINGEPLPDGIYTYFIDAIDKAGNRAELYEGEITVDNTNPETSLSPSALLYNDLYAPILTTYTLTAVDPIINSATSGIEKTEYKIDEGVWNLWSDIPITLDEGRHIILYRSTDNAGNTETDKSFTVWVDNTPPITELQIQDPRYMIQDKIYVSDKTKIILTAVDPEVKGVSSEVARTEYRIDEGEWIVGTSITLTEGIHKLEYRSIDNVGNIEQVKLQIFHVDATPPITSIEVGSPKCDHYPDKIVISSRTQITLEAEDPVVKDVSSGVKEFIYRINGEEWKPVTASFTIPSTYSDGEVTIEFKAVDNVENTKGVESQKLILDNTPPTTEILSPQLNSIINGTIAIIGTVTDTYWIDRGYYKIEYGEGESPTRWIEITTSNSEVQTSNLSYWDTSKLEQNKVYTIKLTSSDCLGNTTFKTITLKVGEPEFILSWGTKSQGPEPNDGEFNEPFGASQDTSGNVFVCDKNNHRVQKFTSDGQFLSKFGTKSQGPKPNDGEFNEPTYLKVDTLDNIYVVDSLNNRVQVFDKNYNFKFAFGSKGKSLGQFDHPKGIAQGTDGNIYVTDSKNHRVQKFNSLGIPLLEFGSYGTGDGEFNQPLGIILDNEGNIYVADLMNDRIQKFDKYGNFLLKIDGTGPTQSPLVAGEHPLKQPEGIYLDRDNNIYVADSMNRRIQKFDRWGNRLLNFGVKGRAETEFNQVADVLLDIEENYIYVTDVYNHRVQKFQVVLNLVSLSPKLREFEKLKASPPLTLTDLYTYPNPFSPNNDGDRDEATIYFELSTPADVHIYIYNVMGKLVKIFDTIYNTTGGDLDSPKWDGRNDLGRVCANGVYIIYLKAKTSEGQTVEDVHKCAILK